MSACLQTKEPLFHEPHPTIRKTSMQVWWPALAGMVVAAGIAVLFAAPREPRALIALPSATTSVSHVTPQISVHGYAVERTYGYVTVTAEASNLSSRSLDNVEAVAEFFDSEGCLLKVETALLELPTIRCGDESPFRIQTREAPDMSSYRIRFRHVLGAFIPARDR